MNKESRDRMEAAARIASGQSVSAEMLVRLLRYGFVDAFCRLTSLGREAARDVAWRRAHIK